MTRIVVTSPTRPNTAIAAVTPFLRSCLCVWFCLLFSQLLLAQEDPHRFLLVTNWTARFTWQVTDQSTYADPNGYSYAWQINVSVMADLHLSPSGPTSWFSSTNLTSQNAQISEHGTTTIPPINGGGIVEFDVTQMDDSFFASNFGGMALSLDPQSGTYQVGFGGAFVLKPPANNSENFLPVLVTLGDAPNVLSNRFVLPGTGLVISGGTTIALASLSGRAASLYAGWLPETAHFGQPLNGTLTLSWVLIGEPLEVVVDIDGYDQWLPEGNLGDGTQPGNNLKVTASLRDQNGQPTSARADTFAFALNNVSRVPGVCMNRPNLDLADTNLDLRFLEANNPYPILVDSEVFAHSAEGPGLYESNQVTISCFDYGAYGTLGVTGYVGGVPITGYLRSDKAHQHPDILLPKRDPNSHIADAWKQANNVTGLPDSDDSESDPAGDGHSGDGLSLYEEYRGFSENSKHLRTNPHKKDLFICDGIGNWRSKNGIQLFQTRSGLAVHHEMRREELSSIAKANDGWINFNKDDQGANHVVDQHGLLLVTWDGPVNQTGSRAHPGGVNSTPGSVSEIRIGASILDPGGGTANIAGINQVTRNGVHILTDDAQASVAHEIAHGCSVYHHGDQDRSKVQWLVKLDTTVIPATYQVFEVGVPITVLAEGPPVAVLQAAPFLGQRTVWLGMPQGQHSGDEECFMRYDCADAYPETGSEIRRFWIAGTEVSTDSPELAGIFLCASPAGTGVNLAGRQPQPRYGDADATHRRGNCAGQLCVNDLYLSSSLHNR